MPSCEKIGRTIAPHKILSKIDGVAWCTGREFFIEDFPRNRAVTLSIDLDPYHNIHDLQKGQHSKTLHEREYLGRVQPWGTTDNRRGEESSCKCHHEDKDHQKGLWEEAVGKVGVEYEQEDGEGRGHNGSDHRGECEAPESHDQLSKT